MGHLLWSRSNKLSGGVYGLYRKVAALVGEEDDGAFILVTVWLGRGEGGTEEGLPEFSAQGPPSGSYGHFPSPDVQGGFCLLVRGRAGQRVQWDNSRRSGGKA